MGSPLTKSSCLETSHEALLRQRIISLVRDCSIETTPRESEIFGSYRNLLRPGMSVNIAYLPGASFTDTIETARRLRKDGLNPVPHLPARAITSEAMLRETLHRLCDAAGITDVLVIAGDLTTPQGPFNDSMTLLKSGVLQDYGISQIGVAGHPEGSPAIDAAILRNSLIAKNSFAADNGIEMFLATQFCLDAVPIMSWERATRRDGNHLPIDVGLAGATTLKSLLKFAKLCGVGASRRVLARNTKKLVRLSAVSYPDRILAAIAHQLLIDPACQFRRPHFFPFGGLERTAHWLDAVASGAFTLNEQANGFDTST